tara:strand:+ start:716 stop:1153 length:438 start_codon:yes stop_codon:yes gene_type:complete
MKNVFLIAMLCLAVSSFAEVYEDYAPSEEHVQLTVVSVEPNYLDDYLVKLKRTWVRGMEIQKELGYIVDYSVYTSDSANSPNVWLTITYENMAAMQPSEEKYKAINKEWMKRHGDENEEIDEISKGYEDIRKMVDSQIINKVNFK